MAAWQTKRLRALSLAFLVAAAPAVAAEPSEPLLGGLGELSYPVTTRSDLAQSYFDQGYRWLWAFNHTAARRAFREAQRHDPGCALCFWGEAYVLGPNINAPMAEEANAPALAALDRALALAPQATPREQALIAALAERYSAEEEAERAELDSAYAEAMARVHRRFPNDPDVAILYADAVMNTSPWDYWEAGGRQQKAGIAPAIDAVEAVLAERPDHVGAIHLYIHLTEASASPERAEPYAERLAGLMPAAGHIVHMGAHTFNRIGRFKDSLALNKQAVEADVAYFARFEEEHSDWRYGYHPHNIHYVVTSALMVGDGETALAYADRLDRKIPDTVASEVGWIQAIRQAPYFAYAHFSDRERILELEPPEEGFPFVEAAWRYARGVAFALGGEAERAAAEADGIAAIRESSDVQYPADIAPAVPGVLAVAEAVVRGRIAQGRRDWDDAVAQFRLAVEQQDALPYMEPPFWYYPVRQSLGAALLQAGRPAEAEAVFRESLERIPGNGWALYGLLRAQEAQAKSGPAQTTRKRFRQAWAGGPTLPDLGRL